MGVYIWNKLPSEYQEVEWIQSTGTQYINTGKTVSGNCKIDYTYMPKEAVSSSTSGGLLVFMDNDRRSNGFGSGNTYLYYGGYTSNNEGYTVGLLQQDVLCHDIVSKSGCSRTINGNTVSYVPQSSYPSPTGNLLLFVSQRAGSIFGYWKTRMYSFKRYDSGVLTQDLIPCYRKSDNVIGMYDLVNNQFYTNSGSGTFSKGSDVNNYHEKELKNAYIGEVWTPGANTLAYWKFKSDIYDYSGNGNNWDSGSGTYSDNMLVIGKDTPLKASNSIITDASNFTFITWLDCSSTYNGSTCINSNSSYSAIIAFWNRTNNLEFGVNTGTWYTIVGTYSSGVHNFVGVRNGNTIYFYIDGELQGNKAISGTIGKGTRVFKGNSTPLKIGETIVEKGAWTAQEVAHYFDITKSNYGL